MAALSVVIPTYNRGALIAETLSCCRRRAGGVELEFIVIDDGSSDDTAARLARLAEEMPNLRWRSIPNGGPGNARNIGAAMASHDVILFLGDDIQPTNDEFFRSHTELHQRFPDVNVAVLGKVEWSARPGADISFVMSHIQGLGGEQFGYAHLPPYSWLDWRFFYTANVSIKKAAVEDWSTGGYDHRFKTYGYEDIELAYRLHKRHGAFRIFYTPLSNGIHRHPYAIEGFMNRQVSAGMMARTFLDMHPELDVQLGAFDIERALRSPEAAGDESVLADYMSVVEGLKAWARLMDSQYVLGTHHWHGEMLKAVFALCYQQGYLLSTRSPTANLCAAYRHILAGFRNQMLRVMQVEVTGAAADPAALLPLQGAPAIPVASWVKSPSAFRIWARRQPILVWLYRRLRG